LARFSSQSKTPEFQLLEHLKAAYSLAYSFCYFYDRAFLPPVLHVYAYAAIKQGAVEDYWSDWVWTGFGPYSVRLGYDILELKELGLLEEVCVDGLCGFLTVPRRAPKPDKLVIALF